MEKNLEYYLNLPYKIEVTPILDSLGGGFSASLPEVGRRAVVGDGETIDEAIKNLEKPAYEEPVTVSGPPGPGNYGR